MNVKQTRTHNETMNLPEVTLTLGDSVLVLVLRPEGDDPNGADACVLKAAGKRRELVALMSHFMEKHPKVLRITNQVSNEKELRAMHTAKFRYYGKFMDTRLSTALASLKERGSIMLVWDR